MESLISTAWDNNSRPSRKLNRASALFDAFGRLRVADVSPLFDSKLSLGKLPLYWDEVVSANASSLHVEVDSCVNMTVTANGAYAIRQTRQRWNYQPGRSQNILATFKASTAQGVTCRVGAFHGNYTAPYLPHDGIYFEVSNGIASCNIVKGTESGGVVGTQTAKQSEWNIDRLDGTGPSGYTADWSKAQILAIDFQWLGIGGVRFGIEVDSVIHYVHEFKHAGLVSSVYMHNGTQPIRYEIRSTGGTGTLMQICTSVSSEGGASKTGITAALDTDGILVNCPISVTTMLLALRIDPTNPDAQLLIEKVYSLNTAANTNYRWTLLFNPTITGGTPNWVNVAAGVPVQLWQNPGAVITLTGGLPLDSGYASRDTRQSNDTTNPSINPGISINGTPDIIALGIESIGGQSSCAGGIGIRHLV